nr:ribonuclease H-like domain-containing protein [Tanacetum cinerariifolium]
MCDEYKALIDNNTWVLVPRPQNVNIVCSIWLYKQKYNADGSSNWYKARLVANGRSQQQGIDCDERFIPVVKPATIRTVISLAISQEWPIHQLDMKNAFLHGHLTETVHMHQPPKFIDSAHSDYVCLLKVDSSLFIFHNGPDTCDLLLYVDDIILTAFSTSLLQRIISLLHEEFAMTNLGPLNYFLVQQLCLYMHDPREPHLNAMKHVLCYLRGTTNLGLQLFRSTTSHLIAYSDADWAGCLATRRFTYVYYVFLGDNLLTWSSKRQDTLYHYSVEAEYRGVGNAVAKTSWIRNLLRELHASLFTTTLVYCDNVSVVYMYANPVQHQCTKHIEIAIHFVRDKVAAGHVRVLHDPSRFQYANIFTKSLPYPLFADFRSSLSVHKTFAQTARAY